MPALEATRTLDLVACEDLRVGHHDELCFLKKKTTPYRPNFCAQSFLRFTKVVLAPYLKETLALSKCLVYQRE